MRDQTLKHLDLIAQAIYDKKGFNILVLDVQGISTMTDYYVVAEGNVDRHLKALAQAIRQSLGTEGLHPFHTEGEQAGDWVVIDFSDIVIHLFTPEMREKYAIEELWKESKIVDVNINIEK